MTGSALRNLHMLAKLCGKQAMPNVIIATTMWGKFDKKDGERREAELERDVWTEMMADGCRIERFENTYESAWRIVGSFTEKERALLSSEIVDNGRQLMEPKADIQPNPTTQKMSTVIVRKFRKWFSR
jgi:hypothetical protein